MGGEANVAYQLLARGLALAVEKADTHGQPPVFGSEPQLDAFLARPPDLLDRHGAQRAERRLQLLLAADFELVALELPAVGDRQLDAPRRKRHEPELVHEAHEVLRIGRGGGGAPRGAPYFPPRRS